MVGDLCTRIDRVFNESRRIASAGSQATRTMTNGLCGNRGLGDQHAPFIDTVHAPLPSRRDIAQLSGKCSVMNSIERQLFRFMIIGI